MENRVVCFTSPRLVFRRFCVEDLGSMRLLESDPDVMRFTPMRMPLSLERSEERLNRLLCRTWASDFLGIWAAETSSGEFVGWFMLEPTNLPGPELGFMLVRNQWGRGFATEAAVALLERAAAHGYPESFAVVDDDNSASIRVLEKAGFRFDTCREEFDPKLQRVVRGLVYRRS